MQIRKYSNTQINKYAHAVVVGLVVCVVSIGLFVTGVVGQIFAHDGDHIEDLLGTDAVQQQYERLEDIRSERARLEALLKDAKNREKSLVSELNYLSTLIRYTEYDINATMLEIGQTQELVVQLEGDIESLSVKTGVLGDSIGGLERSYHARVRNSYQNEFVPKIGVFLKSENINDAVLRFAYLERLQEEDMRFLDKLRDTKDEYTKRTQELETFKNEKETLRTQLEEKRTYLENQKAALSKQQSTQNWLLAQTKNEEKNYQTLIKQIESEIAAIRAALTAKGVSLGTVQPGDVIGYLGNTGCSTGPHVHFGYYINNIAVNPRPYLDSGELQWPLASPRVSQNYGENYEWYMSVFGMPGHNGIDITDSLLPGEGAPVLAAKAGTAYSVVEGTPCSLTGTRGVGVRIDHPDGTKTIYWHLQAR